MASTRRKCRACKGAGGDCEKCGGTGAVANTPTLTVWVDGKEHIATLTTAGVLLREKGKRTTYGPVSYGHIQLAGARMMANANREWSSAPPRTEAPTRRVKRGLL